MGRRPTIQGIHGNDLIVYPDGLSMASDEQRRFRQQYEAEPRETVDKVLADHGLEPVAGNEVSRSCSALPGRCWLAL